MKKQKGSVLAFVLVAAVVMMIICAGLLRMVLMRSSASTRVAQGQAGRKNDDAAVALLSSAFSPNGERDVCYSTAAAVVGYTCSGQAAGTNCYQTCTCTPVPACACPAAGQSTTTSCPPTITVSDGLTAGSCTFSVASCQ